MGKIIKRPWTQKEEVFLRVCVEKNKLHLEDIVPLWKGMFGYERSFYSLQKRTIVLGISYAGLVPKKVQEEYADVGRVIRKPKTLTEVEMRELLSKKGYKVEKIEQEKIDRRVAIDPSVLFSGDEIKFAVVSCSHLGSKYQQLSFLKAFYRQAQDEGVRAVLHCGDMVDGIDVYRGQTYELFLHGAKAQRDYAVENYPRMESGGKTFIISGNHDYSFMKKAGEDVLEGIAKERKDIDYLGVFGAYPEIKVGGRKLRIYMQHGEYGVSYARSYRLQKNIEQFSPGAKPDIYFLGHFHVSTALFEYRNVIGFMIPCFQSQTPYLRRKNLYPEVGGLVISFTVNDVFRKNALAVATFKWIPFYVPKENDY